MPWQPDTEQQKIIEGQLVASFIMSFMETLDIGATFQCMCVDIEKFNDIKNCERVQSQMLLTFGYDPFNCDNADQFHIDRIARKLWCEATSKEKGSTPRDRLAALTQLVEIHDMKAATKTMLTIEQETTNKLDFTAYSDAQREHLRKFLESVPVAQ